MQFNFSEAAATSVTSCDWKSYKFYFMTESQCTEKVCVSKNCFMKSLSRALKDSTKDSLSSRDTRSDVCTSVMVYWLRSAHILQRWSCSICT